MPRTEHDSTGVEIDLADLATERGVVAAAVKMAEAMCKDMLFPVVQHTPPEMRQALLERFLCAIAGVMCAELGPERAKESLDAAKLAIDDVIEARRRAAN